MSTHVHHLRIHQIYLPMRVGFKHAAADRKRTENLIVELELGSGIVGYGEAVPREYVSGETLAGAAAAVRDALVEPLMSIRPNHFSDLLGSADALPFTDGQGRAITSARAAVELALLDAYSKAFRRGLDEIAGWLGATLFGSPGSAGAIRYSGVLSAGDARHTIRRLWVQRRLLGLRDFKLKVGGGAVGDDRAVLEAVVRRLGKAIAAGRARRNLPPATAGGEVGGRASLRVDANGAFSPQQAADWIERMADLPIASLEQPMAREHDAFLPRLRSAARRIPLMADESLVTPADADRLIAAEAVDLFNIRVSKNGGLIAAMRLAERATTAGVGFQLGCMVGETGILSAAGRWFLRLVKRVRFAEGSFGRLLLADDITRPSPRFGRGGRITPMTGLGLGVRVLPEKLAKYAVAPVIEVQL